MFLRPYVSDNTAFTVTTPPVPPAPGAFPLAVGSAQNQPIDWGLGQGFQAWVGWTHTNGWGVRADMFGFNHGSNVNTYVIQPNPLAPQIVTVPGIIPPIPGAAGFAAPTAILAGAGIGADRLVVTSDLNIRSTDIEATYQWTTDDCLVRLSFGGRWQSLRQGYHAAVANPGDGVMTEMQAIDFTQQFSGAGPTIGLFLKHGISGDLSAYGSVRGALLFGQIEQHAAYAQDISDPNLTAFVGSQATRTRFDNRADRVLTYGDLEFGLEYGIPIGHARLFFRGGVNGQAYANAFNATGTTGTLGLFGGTAAMGLNY